MEELEKVKKEIGEFIEKLLSLVPPYDKISILSRECGFSRNFGELSKVHPEYFYPTVFTIIQKLLGIKIDSSGVIDFDYDGIGHNLNRLIAGIYGILDDDEFRKELSNFIGKELPNPLEEYVKACVEAIKQQDNKMIEILRMLAERSYELQDLKNELERRGLKVEEDELKGYLRTLMRLGLVEKFYTYSIIDRIKRHLMKFIK